MRELLNDLSRSCKVKVLSFTCKQTRKEFGSLLDLLLTFYSQSSDHLPHLKQLDLMPPFDTASEIAMKRFQKAFEAKRRERILER